MNQIQLNKLEFFREVLNDAINEGKINNWTSQIIKNKKSNIYLEKDFKIESILNSNSEDVVIDIYKDFKEEIGENSFTVSLSEEKEDFEEELNDAIFICSTSKSKKYDLPKKEDKIIDDSNIDYSIYHNEKFFEDFDNGNLNIFFAQKIKIFKKLLEEKENVSINLVSNSIEVLTSVKEIKFESNDGIIKEFKKNSSYLELIITVKNKETKKDTEHVVYQNINDIYSFDFEKFFDEKITEAIDTSKSKAPDNFKGVVILKNHSTKDFFLPDPPSNPLMVNCFARLKHLGTSTFEIGKEIVESKYDKLSISSNPFVQNDPKAIPFDGNGISARRIDMIKENVFTEFVADKKFGDYISANPSGPFGVIEVGVGKKSMEELYQESQIIEIINFAWFSPDQNSGEFSAEIRLGYFINDGVRIPFKGGLFTGNVFEVIKEIELSKEKYQEVGYLGPKYIKFHKGEIVGF